ncbi:MAG: hypothetical protein HGA45_33695 [Chloroflexales bacterium]|nr:hypothetical protein [Chloroflexales bacterium]
MVNHPFLADYPATRVGDTLRVKVAGKVLFGIFASAEVGFFLGIGALIVAALGAVVSSYIIWRQRASERIEQ